MTEKNSAHANPKSERPDIFKYHDYRAFLNDWFAYLKRTQADFSVRALAKSSGFSSAYLPMVISGKRNLTWKSMMALLPQLRLQKNEQTHLENLLKLGTDSHHARASALNKMSSSHSYQKRNPKEAEFFRYMSHWYYIAIREMATLPEFKLDPVWIHEKLQFKVSIPEIETALEFLKAHGYIEISSEGVVAPSKDLIDCHGRVFAGALMQYHRQMFSLAADSMERIVATERDLLGYTFSLNAEEFKQAQSILRKAVDDIEAMEKSRVKPVDSVYHLELALFPITKKAKQTA